MRRGVAVAATLAVALAVVFPADGGRSLERAGGTVVKYLPAGSVAQPPAWASAAPKAGGLAVDADGNVYVSAWNPPTAPAGGRSDIAVFDRNGKFLRTFGVGIRGSQASVLATGPNGLVYATISGGGEGIAVYTTTGALVRTIGQSAALKNVHDLEVDASGNLYVTNDDPPSVVRLDAAGNVTARWPVGNTGASPRLRGLALAPDGSVYVTRGYAKHPLVHLDANGKELSDGPKLEVLLAEGKGQVNDVEFAGGNLYIAAQLNLIQDGIAVVTTVGKLVDMLPSCSVAHGTAPSTCPAGSKPDVTQVAVAGKDVYATGYPAAASAARATAAVAFPPFVTRYNGQTMVEPGPGESGPFTDCAAGQSTTQNLPGSVPTITLSGSNPCNDRIGFTNHLPKSPCFGTDRLRPGRAFLGGRQVGRLDEQETDIPGAHQYQLEIPRDQLGAGSVVAEFVCTPASAPEYSVYEHKGDVVLHDPSGNVLDAKTGGPVDAARVSLQLSPTKSGPFGIPGPAGISPQLNPQMTGRSGFFGWDVADGYWRLRVTAFGYLRFTSPVYKVPPAITGLRLKLKQNPAQQARLIDPYAGRVGMLTVGGSLHVRLPAGVKLTIKGHRIRKIVVHARRFRTARGISLGSRELALFAAYPQRQTTASAEAARKGTYRVGRVTFTLRSGRVVGIAAGR